MSFRGQWQTNNVEKAVTDYIAIPSTSHSKISSKPIGRYHVPKDSNISKSSVNVATSSSGSAPSSSSSRASEKKPGSSLPRSTASAPTRSANIGTRRASSIVNIRATPLGASIPSPPIGKIIPPVMMPTKSGVINGGNGPIIGVTMVPKSPIRAQSFAAQPNTPLTGFPTPPSGDSSPSTRERVFSRSQSASENNHSTLNRVLDYLFFGSFENAANTRWLCANRIAYIVNLTGTPRMKARGCDCGESDKYHKQFECTPKKIDATTKTIDIVREFKKCNEFIAEARTNGFRVLVFNEDGEDLCQAVVVQHMMTYFKIPLAHAINQTTRNSERRIRVSEPFMTALRTMEQEMEAASKDPSASSSAASGVTNMLHTFSFRDDL